MMSLLCADAVDGQRQPTLGCIEFHSRLLLAAKLRRENDKLATYTGHHAQFDCPSLLSERISERGEGGWTRFYSSSLSPCAKSSFSSVEGDKIKAEGKESVRTRR